MNKLTAQYFLTGFMLVAFNSTPASQPEDEAVVSARHPATSHQPAPTEEKEQQERLILPMDGREFTDMAERDPRVKALIIPEFLKIMKEWGLLEAFLKEKRQRGSAKLMERQGIINALRLAARHVYKANGQSYTDGAHEED